MVSGNDIRNGRHNHQLIDDQAYPGISIIQELFIGCRDVFILVNDFQERRKIRNKQGKQSCSNALRHGLLLKSFNDTINRAIKFYLQKDLNNLHFIQWSLDCQKLTKKKFYMALNNWNVSVYIRNQD